MLRGCMSSALTCTKLSHAGRSARSGRWTGNVTGSVAARTRSTGLIGTRRLVERTSPASYVKAASRVRPQPGLDHRMARRARVRQRRWAPAVVSPQRIPVWLGPKAPGSADWILVRDVDGATWLPARLEGYAEPVRQRDLVHIALIELARPAGCV